MNTKFTKASAAFANLRFSQSTLDRDISNVFIEIVDVEKSANDMYEMLESKLDLIRCGIGANYSGDPKQNPEYLEVVELLKRARGEHEY